MKTQHQKIKLQRALIPCTMSLLALQLFLGGAPDQRAGASPAMAGISSVGFNPPPPPPDRDAPGSRGGGAGRGCSVGQQSVMALVPEYQQALPQGGAITKVWGTTTAERPTFWFDLPYEGTAIASLEFVLQDNSSPVKELYRSPIAPPKTPGIVGIHLPETVPPLETGRLYQWYFKVRLQCGSGPAATSEIKKEQVRGWVQRVNPDAALSNKLKQTTPDQRVALYAQNGIWFDAVTTLAELRLANPQAARLTKDWHDLLQSIGLEKLATKPLVPCCKPLP